MTPLRDLRRVGCGWSLLFLTSAGGHDGCKNGLALRLQLAKREILESIDYSTTDAKLVGGEITKYHIDGLTQPLLCESQDVNMIRCGIRSD